MPRALLTHGKLGPMTSKTANAILRFAPDTVACVVDEDHAGRSAADVLGSGPDVPVVADGESALDLGADEIVVGVAPVGGELPDAWRADLAAFLAAGRTVTSGLHTFLADDPKLAEVADRNDGRIRDLRRPPADRRIATGDAGDVDADVIYVGGTDCSSGKMTTAYAATQAARDRGIDAAFLATGQTGLLLEPDAGAPMDAVVSDFLAGEMERCVLELADRDVVFVEGQGAMSHPAYGQVTAGMMLGAWPDRGVLTHVAGRTFREGFPEGRFAVPSIAEEAALVEHVLDATSGAEVVAAAVVTREFPEDRARAVLEDVEASAGIPATDPVRFGPEPLLDAVLEGDADGA